MLHRVILASNQDWRCARRGGHWNRNVVHLIFLLPEFGSCCWWRFSGCIYFRHGCIQRFGSTLTCSKCYLVLSFSTKEHRDLSSAAITPLQGRTRHCAFGPSPMKQHRSTEKHRCSVLLVKANVTERFNPQLWVIATSVEKRPHINVSHRAMVVHCVIDTKKAHKQSGSANAGLFTVCLLVIMISLSGPPLPFKKVHCCSTPSMEYHR